MMDPWESLLEQIRRERGLDLASYKSSFLRRRLAIRLRARSCPDYASYGRLLAQEPAEYGPLLDALTIGQTRFFRDFTTFEAIEHRFLPELLEARAEERRLRIWSAGCASGEEPYSLAILLREVLGPQLARWQLEILASDIDEVALAKARAGFFDASSFEGLAPRYQAWIERYFSPGPRRRLAAEVRDMVEFRHHDLTQDPPPAGLDLLLCRNVLIYFDRGQQERLYQAFHRSLREGGFLVLGKTEMLPMAWSQRFVSVDLREHIYRRVAVEAERGSSRNDPVKVGFSAG